MRPLAVCKNRNDIRQVRLALRSLGEVGRCATYQISRLAAVPLVAKHASLRTLGFSIVTDMCLPDALEPVDIEKILAVAAQGGERLAKLIPAVVARIGDD